MNDHTTDTADRKPYFISIKSTGRSAADFKVTDAEGRMVRGITRARINIDARNTNPLSCELEFARLEGMDLAAVEVLVPLQVVHDLARAHGYILIPARARAAQSQKLSLEA